MSHRRKSPPSSATFNSKNHPAIYPQPTEPHATPIQQTDLSITDLCEKEMLSESCHDNNYWQRGKMFDNWVRKKPPDSNCHPPTQELKGKLMPFFSSHKSYFL